MSEGDFVSPAGAKQFWHKQLTESNRAYQAFSVYRDMGVARSLDKAYVLLWKSLHQTNAKSTPENGTLKIPKQAPRHWSNWSIQHAWVERVNAFDAYIEAQAQEAFERDLIVRRQQTLRDEYDAAMGQLKLWQAEYDAALRDAFDIKALNLLARLRTTLNAQRRLALGMPTSTADVTSGGEKLPGNVVLNVDDLADVFRQIRQHKEAENDAGS